MLCRYLLPCLMIVAATGCPNLKGPGYLHPGTAAYQQGEAQRFDPFPETDVGPDMAARPLAYMRPAPETERNQNAVTFTERYGTAPPPGIYRPTRTVPGRMSVPYLPAPPPVQSAPLFAP
jgi:hypothetical protein